MDEKWKSVVGYEGLYEVSDWGRVKSLEKTVTYIDGRLRKYPETVMKTPNDSVGYPYTRLVKNKKGTTYRVHELVVKAFKGDKPQGKTQIRHLNDIKTDNRVENLEWGTAAENMADKFRNGYRPEKPTHCIRGHELTDENTYKKSRGRRNCITCGRAYGQIRSRYGKVNEGLYEEYFRENGV